MTTGDILIVLEFSPPRVVLQDEAGGQHSFTLSVASPAEHEQQEVLLMEQDRLTVVGEPAANGDILVKGSGDRSILLTREAP
jgi:hypothetical protein